ncbi:hypothetical protein CEE37_07185 [candidate division LCP-89 bacterium B3_LCP]|uniref:Uncharacterized protein n=1 Tax=candidate division LCP-89 bacterium B3_LCP TaxID=2012998 RepID=A0A532V0K3_UNCL8|nr:MAG: hypothetical protein CEE37_07185 [candidate division LCP-89 bacterium B3_LCP]
MLKKINFLITMLILFPLMVMTFGGCAPSTPKIEEPVVLPTFDFVPPSTTPVSSTSVSFCVVSPSFPSEWKALGYMNHYPYDKFARNMPADFEEMLTAKGFRTRGPFRNYDELTFPDKSETDLILMPKVEIDVRAAGRTTESINLLGDARYKWNGTIHLSGRITIALNETLSNERMWNKSVELPQRQFSYKSPSSAQPVNAPNINDTKFANELAKYMEEYYNLTFDKMWDYLDPNEMTMVKDQAQEIKDKKRY